MNAPVDFYFDFSSPYGYFAAQKIDELIEGFDRKVVWRPIMIGAAMKETGGMPLTSSDLKKNYAINDCERLARFQGLTWRLPVKFPIMALAPARAFYWISDQDEGAAKAFAWNCFTAFFAEGEDISKNDVVASIASRHGFVAEDVAAALKDQSVKQRLKDETAAAIDRGVFGSPFIIVDGESFWGADRLWMVKRWLRSGGW